MTHTKKTLNATEAAAFMPCSRQWFYKLADQYGIQPDPKVSGRQWKRTDIARVKAAEEKAGRLGGNK